MPRCFIGIKVTWPGYEKLKYDLQKKDILFGKWVELNNLHITLKFLGNIENSILENLQKKLENHNISSFSANFHSLDVFPNINIPRILYIKVDGDFIKLKNFVENICSYYNFEKEERYIPHLTILRIKKLKRKNKFLDILKDYQNKIFFTMKITEFQLFESTLTPNGPIYKILSSYKLK